jgi:hypothetical protein
MCRNVSFVVAIHCFINHEMSTVLKISPSLCLNLWFVSSCKHLRVFRSQFPFNYFLTASRPVTEDSRDLTALLII